MSRKNHQSRLAVESLERRENPSLSFMGGVMTVVGDDSPSSINDTIRLSTSTDADDNAIIVVTQNGRAPWNVLASGITSIVVDAKTGNDVVEIDSVLASTRVTVLPGSGSNTVHLSRLAMDLDTVRAWVTVWGQGGTDVVQLHDRNDATGVGYRVTDQTVEHTGGRAFAGLSMAPGGSAVDAMTLYAHNQASSVFIDGTRQGSSFSLSGGSAAETVYVGIGNLDAVEGGVNVYGNAGVDRVFVRDSATSYNDAYSITNTVGASTLARNFFGGLTFSSTVETLDIQAQQGNNTFSLGGLPVVTAVTLNANGGTDTIVGPNAANTWNLRGNWDSSIGTVTFQNAEHLRGGSMNDTFQFQMNPKSWASIDGGGGTDTLNYSAYTTAGVAVDLGAGVAAFVTGSVSNVENVTGTRNGDTLRGNGVLNVMVGGDGNDRMYGGGADDTMDGGAGNDIMFGQDGADVMNGGSGRDIMFGGRNEDWMHGGGGDDIMGSDTTTFENDQTALNNIQAEWTSGRSYDDRVWNLRGNAANSSTFASRANGNSFLTTAGPNATVSHPTGGDEDIMIGGLMTADDGNDDWFFGHAGEYPDREAGESVNA